MRSRPGRSAERAAAKVEHGKGVDVTAVGLGDGGLHGAGPADESPDRLHPRHDLGLVQGLGVVGIGRDYREHTGLRVVEHGKELVLLRQALGNLLHGKAIELGPGQFVGGDETRAVQPCQVLEERHLVDSSQLEQALFDSFPRPLHVGDGRLLLLARNEAIGHHPLDESHA